MLSKIERFDAERILTVRRSKIGRDGRIYRDGVANTIGSCHIYIIFYLIGTVNSSCF